jgi:hypothetical protein
VHDLNQREKSREGKDRCASQAESVLAGEELKGQSQADSCELKKERGEEKAKGGLNAYGSSGKFHAVGLAMEKSDSGDQERAELKWNGLRHGEQCPKANDACKHNGFHKGELNTIHAKRRSNKHGSEEGKGQHPKGAVAELHSPKPDSQHGQEVIESRKGMKESPAESVYFRNMAGVGMGPCGNEG